MYREYITSQLLDQRQHFFLILSQANVLTRTPSMKVAVVLLLAAVCAFANPAKLPGQAHTHAHNTQPIIPYNFGYEVADVATNNFQNRAEIKTPNGDVFGSYSWLMPTNEILTLTYNVTGNLGFRYSINITPVGPAAGVV